MHLKRIYKLLAIVITLAITTPMVSTASPVETETTESQGEDGGETEEPEQTEAPSTDGGTNETDPKETDSPKETDEKPGETDKKPDDNKDTDETDETNQETDAESPDDNNQPEQQPNEVDNSSNEELIEEQDIVEPPEFKESFRFRTVDKEYAVVKENGLKVYAEKDEESDEVGALKKYVVCYILEQDDEEDEEWVYIESGTVRGFVYIEDLFTGDKAEAYALSFEEEEIDYAKDLVDPLENPALDYTKTTTIQTVVDKVYGISIADGVQILEEKDEDARAVGTLGLDALCYVLEDQLPEEEEEELLDDDSLTEELLEEDDLLGEDESESEDLETDKEAEEDEESEDDEDEEDLDWLYVESDDVRGFVRRENLLLGEDVPEIVELIGEDKFDLAEELIAPEDNAACYYTLTTVKESGLANTVRTTMVNFAMQFLGNPYVWGGTSLTQGADCSGFVQSIYRQFGYELPRVAEDQAKFGMQIPVAAAAPGDLIFYAKNGYVYHVVMYIGDGKVIHASGVNRGVIISNIYTANAVWATRVIDDTVDVEVDE